MDTGQKPGHEQHSVGDGTGDRRNGIENVIAENAVDNEYDKDDRSGYSEHLVPAHSAGDLSAVGADMRFVRFVARVPYGGYYRINVGKRISLYNRDILAERNIRYAIKCFQRKRYGIIAVTAIHSVDADIEFFAFIALCHQQSSSVPSYELKIKTEYESPGKKEEE